VTGSVVVIGAINVDLVVSGAALPAPGQTVTGGVFAQHHGGKGGNQAVAAARALGGGPGVVMVGAVGNDALGHDALDALRAEGVATSVAMRPGVPTGVALICVGPDGENQISVAPGANAELSASNVTSAFAQVHPVGVVLASLEVSHGAVRAAGAWCSEHQVPFVLNPAPEQAWVGEVAALAAYVTPNEHELEALGTLPDGVVIVQTRGEEGVSIRRGGEEERVVAAPRVQAVDTTGAGDCFNGVFAAGLAEGLEVAAAAQRATAAAALSVTKVGAREGMPTRDELDAFLRHA
jgi:ribokinase